MSRPTLRHVALAAHVSTATVSRILNGQGTYADDTVAAVRKAAADLGYQTDTAARSMRVGRRMIVAALIDRELTRPTPTRPRLFWLHYLDQLVDRVSTKGAGVLTLPFDAAEYLRELPVDGLIVVSPDADRALDIPSFGLPTAGFAFDDTYTINASHDYKKAAADVWQFLQSRGSKNPGMLLNGSEGTFAQLLRDGYEAAAAGDGNLRTATFTDFSEVADAVREQLNDGVDSLFVPGGISKPIHDALAALGRTDLPVVVQAEGVVEEYLDPPLSTLSFCARECADITVDALLEEPASDTKRRITLPHRLVAR